MKKIILASTSPRRQELFAQLNMPFECVASSYEEDMTKDLPPEELVQELALGKAEDVAVKYPDAIVVGGDTVVVFGGKVQGKPRDAANAQTILRSYSGQCVAIITGIAVVSSKSTATKAITSNVCLKQLSDEEIDDYIATGEPMDKAGAFAVQGIGRKLVERIEGDLDAIMGFPIEEARRMIAEAESPVN